MTAPTRPVRRIRVDAGGCTNDVRLFIYTQTSIPTQMLGRTANAFQNPRSRPTRDLSSNVRTGRLRGHHTLGLPRHKSTIRSDEPTLTPKLRLISSNDKLPLSQNTKTVLTFVLICNREHLFQEFELIPSRQ